MCSFWQNSFLPFCCFFERWNYHSGTNYRISVPYRPLSVTVLPYLVPSIALSRKQPRRNYRLLGAVAPCQLKILIFELGEPKSRVNMQQKSMLLLYVFIALTSHFTRYCAIVPRLLATTPKQYHYPKRSITVFVFSASWRFHIFHLPIHVGQPGYFQLPNTVYYPVMWQMHKGMFSTQLVRLKSSNTGVLPLPRHSMESNSTATCRFVTATVLQVQHRWW
jgi:hypothetical protein